MELELESRLLDAPAPVPDGVQDLTEAFEPHARDPLAGARPVPPVVPPLPPAAPFGRFLSASVLMCQQVRCPAIDAAKAGLQQ
mgnify:CR=1 FL=1